MTNQEEIRERIKVILFEEGASNRGWIARRILEYLRDNDVVIRRERELPECDSPAHGLKGGYFIGDMEVIDTCRVTARYTIEPLIGD